MPFPETVRLPNQRPIFERLEAAKTFGLISDYLLNWHGGSGRLKPAVTVWSAPATNDIVRGQLVAALDGLISAAQIEVLDDLPDVEFDAAAACYAS